VEILHVLLGGALGGMARFWVSGVVGRRVGETFPWGTMAVNASGALAIGFAAALLEPGIAVRHASAGWHFVVYGFLGSYTTVSSFSLQTLLLVRDGEWRRALANTGLSLGLCLAAAAAGFAAGMMLAGRS
jgi:fluoride exporter